MTTEFSISWAVLRDPDACRALLALEDLSAATLMSMLEPQDQVSLPATVLRSRSQLMLLSELAQKPGVLFPKGISDVVKIFQSQGDAVFGYLVRQLGQELDLPKFRKLRTIFLEGIPKECAWFARVTEESLKAIAFSSVQILEPLERVVVKKAATPHDLLVRLGLLVLFHRSVLLGEILDHQKNRPIEMGLVFMLLIKVDPVLAADPLFVRFLMQVVQLDSEFILQMLQEFRDQPRAWLECVLLLMPTELSDRERFSGFLKEQNNLQRLDAVVSRQLQFLFHHRVLTTDNKCYLYRVFTQETSVTRDLLRQPEFWVDFHPVQTAHAFRLILKFERACLADVRLMQKWQNTAQTYEILS